MDVMEKMEKMDVKEKEVTKDQQVLTAKKDVKDVEAVSYTHSTLPTNREVSYLVVAVAADNNTHILVCVCMRGYRK